MTGWADQRVLALDTETSGTNLEDDRIVTACAAIVSAGVVEFQRDWLIAVDVEIPPEASAVNKLTTEYARANGRPAGEVIPEIANSVRYAVHSGMPIVAYNAAFDLTILDRECRHWHGQALAEFCGADIAPVIDPFVLWKYAVQRRKGTRKLVDACAAFGVDLGDNAHEAAADAIAATRVAYKLAQQFPEIGGMSLDALHAAQVVWRAEQCDSLRAYFDSKGIEHDGVDGSWPMRPFQVQEVPA